MKTCKIARTVRLRNIFLRMGAFYGNIFLRMGIFSFVFYWEHFLHFFIWEHFMAFLLAKNSLLLECFSLFLLHYRFLFSFSLISICKSSFLGYFFSNFVSFFFTLNQSLRRWEQVCITLLISSLSFLLFDIGINK